MALCSRQTVNKCPFHNLSSAICFALLCFLLRILLFKITPKHGSERLYIVPKHKKVVMYLTDKIHA